MRDEIHTYSYRYCTDIRYRRARRGSVNISKIGYIVWASREIDYFVAGSLTDIDRTTVLPSVLPPCTCGPYIIIRSYDS
jgi:hypothetical protein